MITFKIILLIICMIGGAFYLGSSATALTMSSEVRSSKMWLFNPTFLAIQGFISLTVLMLFMFFMLDNIENSKVKKVPKYELIQEPVYRQIK